MNSRTGAQDAGVGGEFLLRGSIRQVLLASIGPSLLAIGALCSLYNLFYLNGAWLVKLLSLGWLVWCLWMLWDCVRLHGVWGGAVYLLSLAVPSRLIRVAGVGVESELIISMRVAGCRFDLLRIPAEAIRELNWSTGQATYLAGSDMNDWSVDIRYDPTLTDGPENEDHGFWTAEYVDGPREKMETLGRALVDFLLAKSVPLHIPSPSLVGQTGVLRRLSKWDYDLEIVGDRFHAYALSGNLPPVGEGRLAVVREIRGTACYVEPLKSWEDTSPRR
ncbi:MAG: hypothetical protein ACQKBW_06340 [Puniceicoccales bacterium]